MKITNEEKEYNLQSYIEEQKQKLNFFYVLEIFDEFLKNRRINDIDIAISRGFYRKNKECADTVIDPKEYVKICNSFKIIKEADELVDFEEKRQIRKLEKHELKSILEKKYNKFVSEAAEIIYNFIKSKKKY